MDTTIVPTRYWHRLPDGQLQCDLCPRHCRLQEGQRGLCYVRQRLDDEVKLVISSQTELVGILVDPKAETADIDTTNNAWPKKEEQTDFDQFKEKIKG